jgi:hypothetical protein
MTEQQSKIQQIIDIVQMPPIADIEVLVTPSYIQDG